MPEQEPAYFKNFRNEFNEFREETKEEFSNLKLEVREINRKLDIHFEQIGENTVNYTKLDKRVSQLEKYATA